MRASSPITPSCSAPPRNTRSRNRATSPCRRKRYAKCSRRPAWWAETCRPTSSVPNSATWPGASARPSTNRTISSSRRARERASQWPTWRPPSRGRAATTIRSLSRPTPRTYRNSSTRRTCRSCARFSRTGSLRRCSRGVGTICACGAFCILCATLRASSPARRRCGASCRSWYGRRAPRRATSPSARGSSPKSRGPAWCTGWSREGMSAPVAAARIALSVSCAGPGPSPSLPT